MLPEITPTVLDRLIETAQKNIDKTKEAPARLWFDKVDRVREMEQITQALTEFRVVMQDRDRYREALERIVAADPVPDLTRCIEPGCPFCIATEALKG